MTAHNIHVITNIGHATLGSSPLDERSARHINLYMTAHNIHNRQINMTPTGSDPTVPASEQPQTPALDSTATPKSRIVTSLIVKLLNYLHTHFVSSLVRQETMYLAVSYK
jgi:hypothetical protein